jgi:hypothetical protein
MEDRSCLELSDVRHLLTEVIQVYRAAMHEKNRGIDSRLAAAQLLE